LNIKQKFEKNSLKEVVQLYLIIIIIYALIYILYLNNKTTNESFVKTSLTNNFHAKENKPSDLELLTYFTQLSQKYNMSIDEVKILDNSIAIQTKDTYQNIMTFLSIVNQKFRIRNFEIKKEKNSMYFFISLDKSILLSRKDTITLPKDIKNPFIKRSVKEVQKVREIILNVIVNDEVLIDDAWYKKGDKIYDYKIDTILGGENKVIFTNLKTEEKIIKRVNHE